MSVPRFIVFEGGEGAGKTTQIQALAAAFQAHGHDVLITREPGGTEGAEEIRNLFVTGKAGRWTPETDALLVMAARADHVARKIRPALEAGQIVLCDRFIHSTLAYQGYGHGVNLDKLRQLHDFATGGLWPDRVLWLDVEPRVGLARSTRRLASDQSNEQRFEQQKLAFHEQVRQAFAEMAAADARLVRIDASAPLEAVQAAILRAVF